MNTHCNEGTFVYYDQKQNLILIRDHELNKF